MDRNVDGYELICGMTSLNDSGKDIGIKIFVKSNHPPSPEEKREAYKAVEAMDQAIIRENMRLDPNVHQAAEATRQAIIRQFPCPIYVEEIPNGYCSRACCAFYPWFVVTTHRGRIKIGWRKSVLHIEWTDSAVTADAATIFPKEEAWPGYETTQFDKVIHAHGYDAARGYIERILNWKPEATDAAE